VHQVDVVYIMFMPLHGGLLNFNSSRDAKRRNNKNNREDHDIDDVKVSQFVSHSSHIQQVDNNEFLLFISKYLAT
jgi:hypothetical protein